MMPVVRGAKSTRLQILLYSLSLAVVAVLPIFTGLGHWLYGAFSIVGGVIFVGLALRLFLSRAGETAAAGPDGLYTVKPGAKQARDLFAYSILYLFLLFAALLLEHGLKVGG